MKFYKSVIQFFEERIGEGTAWDLDYGKLLIIGLLISNPESMLMQLF